MASTSRVPVLAAMLAYPFRRLDCHPALRHYRLIVVAGNTSESDSRKMRGRTAEKPRPSRSWDGAYADASW